jgi:putative ABC transport system ATP-binding protein
MSKVSNVALGDGVRPLAVEARGLGKTFHDGARAVEVLRGVNLDVPEGAFMAVRGPSGSGKSTLLHLLGALDKPTTGRLSIGGVELSSLSDKELTDLRSNRIGFVFQFFSLLPTLTAAENVLMPALIAGERPKAIKPRVADLLDLVGLTDRADHLPGQLSGGEQQRISLARALLRQPDLLLADEPTGNLDTANATVVLDLLRKIADEGQTVVMVTHDPYAANYADEIISLLDGRRVEDFERDAEEPGSARLLVHEDGDPVADHLRAR